MKKSIPVLWVFGAAVLIASIGPGAARANDNAAATEAAVSYAQDVYPVLELRCLECHQPGGAGFEKSGLDLRTYDSLMKGTKFGPVVVPHEPFSSNLVMVIEQKTDPSIWMPHKRKKLSKCERLLIRFWISQGARDN